MKHGLNTDMNKNEIQKFGRSQGVGQEIIKIIETGKLVRWVSFDPKTREYKVQISNGVMNIHESKVTKDFTTQEEMDFMRSENT